MLTALREQLGALGVDSASRRASRACASRGGRVRGVRLADGGELPADVVVLATGHSARAGLRVGGAGGIALEPKPFAIGVRIEHPQPLIDEIQYGDAAGHPKLPPGLLRADAARTRGRGVYSFCMCPGGWIVPAATEPDGVVVNGMSLSRRDSPFANSGLVVAVARARTSARPRPVRSPASSCSAGSSSAAFAGRRRLPRAGPAARGLPRRARQPRRSARRATGPGLAPGDLGAGAAAPSSPQALRAGLRRFGARLRGFLFSEAVLVGVETRTSSPVRVLRDANDAASRRRSPGCIPCGEGAGYAGGIVSAALDGMRVASRVLAGAG